MAIKRVQYIINIIIFLTGLGLVACGTHSQRSGSEKYYVVLMGGQSNMVGQGELSDIGVWNIPANITYFNLNRKPDFSPHPTRFGPEVGVSEMLHREFPDTKFILIKYALGGSSLLDWAPDYDREKARITGHPEFGNMFADFFQKVDSITGNYETEMLALLWMQGERDARVPEAGRDYHKNFSAFINAVRERTASKDLPVIFGMINPDQKRYTAVETVRQAQRNVAREFENVHVVETSGLEKREDNLHYSSVGQLLLGRKFGNKLIEIMHQQGQGK